jgi:hypothetical protein
MEMRRTAMVRDFAIRVKQALAIRFHDIGHDGCAIDMGLGEAGDR